MNEADGLDVGSASTAVRSSQRRLIRVVNQEGFLTKTGKSRAIPMNDDVFALLEALKNREIESSLVFTKNGRRLKQSYVEHKFKEYVRVAGLRDDLKFHSLRHTFATWLVQNGASIYEIQRLLGHSDIKTTQIYAHLAASELHSTVNRISFRLIEHTEMQEPLSTVKDAH